MAFLAYFKGRIVRDLGFCQSPMNAWIHTTGLDTYQLRFDRHCDNAQALAEALDAEEKVVEVLYPGLAASPFTNARSPIYRGTQLQRHRVGAPGHQGPRHGGPQRPEAWAATRPTSATPTLCVHPWSTINNGYSLKDNAAMGVDEGLVRVAVGLETASDLIDDFRQALARAPEPLPTNPPLPGDESMKIQINGDAREIPDGLTVSTLIDHEKVKQPLMVTVEYNGEILDRDAFESTAINDGDVVEFLYFMGGGF